MKAGRQNDQTNFRPEASRLPAFQILSNKDLRTRATRPSCLQKPPPSEVAEVRIRGLLDEVGGELQQANLPAFIDALDDGAQRIFGLIHGRLELAEHLFDGIMHDTVADVCLAELDAVFQHGEVLRILPQPASKLLRTFPKAFDEHLLKVACRQMVAGSSFKRPSRTAPGSRLHELFVTR